MYRLFIRSFSGTLVVGLCLLTASRTTEAGSFAPRIANGVASQDFPAVGELLLFSDGRPDGSCSGVMVGCDTFLTAAHCICVTDADDAAGCAAGGFIDPSDLYVYLQHAGLLEVKSATINSEYNFGIGGDIAVVKLSTPVNGVSPIPINRTRQPAFGESGTLVGFGSNGLSTSVGVKQMGKVTIAACTPDHPNDRNVCWSFREPQGAPGSNSDTCEGDSGGPLMIDFGDGAVVAGLTSGGSADTCLPPDDSFDTDVFFYRDFVASLAGLDLDNTRCGDLPQVGEDGVVEQQNSTTIAAGQDRRYPTNIPIGTRIVRFTLNGDTGASRRGNDFDLFVRHGELPTATEFDCRSDSELAIESCEILSPQPGEWNLLVRSVGGQGLFQLTTTAFAGCISDCDANGAVGVGDLAQVIQVALGQEAITTCGGGDANADGAITVEDVILALEAATTSCIDSSR